MNFDPSENEPSGLQPDRENAAPYMAELANAQLKPEPWKPLSFSGIVAWCAVILMTVGMMWLTSYEKSLSVKESKEASSGDLLQIQMQGKMLIGQKNFLGSLPQPANSNATSNEPSEPDEADEKDDAESDSEDSDSDESDSDESDSEESDVAEPDIEQSEGNDSDAIDDNANEDESDAASPADNGSIAEPEEAVEAIAGLDPNMMDVGTYEQRLCYAIIVSELDSPASAKRQLKWTDWRAQQADFEPSEDQQKLRTTLGELFENQIAGDFECDLAEEKSELVKSKLGWLGQLALVPDGSPDKAERSRLLGLASRSLILSMVGFGVGLLMLFAGVVCAGILISVLASKKMRTNFALRFARQEENDGKSKSSLKPPLGPSNGHNIYIETFAIWMALFFGSQILIPGLFVAMGVRDPLTLTSMMPVLFFGSLIALVWPVMRGIPGRQVLDDIGWRFGNPFVEGGSGIVGYLAILPVLAIALVGLTLFLNFSMEPPSPEVFAKSNAPGHPIQEYAGESNMLLIGLVVMLACIAAPIVEETMFRGVLFRHLRESTGKSSMFLSFCISAIVNSFIFAAIHPQGLMGIPVLMALAIGFSFLREWRDSLVAPMLMHAVHNAVITFVLFNMA